MKRTPHPRHVRPRILGFMALFFVTAHAGPAALTLHVSPSGDDSNPGTREAPFATPARAVERLSIRTVEESLRPAEIILHAGTYRGSGSLKLGPAESGTASAPVTWRAAGDGPVTFSGSIDIPETAISEVTDAVTLARLPENLQPRAKLYEIPLAKLGLEDFPVLNPRGFKRPAHPVWPELFQQHKPLALSAWPNGTGYANGFRPSKVFDPATNRPVPAAQAKEKAGTDFYPPPAQAQRWRRAMNEFKAQPWFGGHWFWDWADDFLRVRAITKDGRVRMSQTHRYGAGKHIQLRIHNLVEEMDRTGEYTLDVPGKRILVLLNPVPTDGLSLTWLGDPFFEIKKAAHLRFEGIRFDGCRIQAVHIDQGQDIEFSRCTFTLIGETAIEARGDRIAVRDCVFTCLGAGGVSLDGGDRPTLRHSGNIVEHCRFEDFGRLRRTYAPGVSLAGVGHTVRHCRFTHAPHSAIHFSGNEHQIRNNEISSVLLETGDCGAIYGGRDWAAHGTVIAGNWIHRLGGDAGRYACGIYLDDQLSGITVTGNWVDQVALGLLIGGGRHNLVQGNIISNARHGIHADARGLGRLKAALFPILKARLEEIPRTEEPWRSRYPMLLNLLQEQPGKPLGTRITGNALVACETEWSHTDARRGAVLAPNFAGVPKSDLVTEKREVWVRNTPLQFGIPVVGPRVHGPRDGGASIDDRR